MPDMARRGRSNPLALAILCVLRERPRHPYDVATTLKTRKKHESIKLNYGSLYNVVDALERDGFIEVVETVREGRRPERTIYGITDRGMREMTDWLADLVATPEKEYTQFEAALSLLPALPPDEAADLLEARAGAIEVELARHRAEQRVFQDELGLPRLFALEAEYSAALLRAELEHVTDLAAEIRKGTLDGIDLWNAWYAPGATFGALPDGWPRRAPELGSG
jgi:DNA-binding PadR family transcriptional regulator